MTGSTERRLRLAVNAVAYAPGGGLTYLVNQARELETHDDWDITYFVSPRCFDRLNEVVPGDRIRIPFARRPSLRTRVSWEQLKLPVILAKEGYDILYVLGAFAVFRSPIPQAVLDANPNHHARYADVGDLRTFLRGRFERVAARFSARRAESVIYLSHSYSEAMQAIGFPAPDVVLPSGVSEDWAGASDDDDVPLACEHCREGGYVLAVHNWYPHKQIEWLVESWVEAPGGRHLVVVGQKPGGRRGQRVSVLENDPSVRSVVHMVDGVSRAALARLFEGARLYVSAATLEAFPLTPFEAMSFGVACVLSDIGPHREIVGDAAEFFTPLDKFDLIRALERADRAHSTLVEKGRNRARPRWSENVDMLLEALEALTRTANSGAR
jgi:glycosyltransferase involved in cell wall biosynthesis